MEKPAHKIEEKERTSDIKLADKMPFSKMILSASVRNGLSKAGFLYPTMIQANAIPMGIAGIDLVVQSKSGTGKTLIFAVVLLETFNNEIHEPQALILAPTREIAVQIESTLNVIGSCIAGFSAVSVIGGLEVTGDRKKLQNARAIVGTPGRVLHLIKNGVLNTSKVKLLVIDEADKMMNATFRSDFDKIYSSLPAKRQIIASSATFSENLDVKLAKFMRNPLLISTDKRETLLVGIKQLVYEISEEKTSILEMTAKIAGLKQIFSNVSFKQCLIFASSQSKVETYRSFLEKDGWPCDIISGAQDQITRLEMFAKFREFKTRILIATDLMSRGVDSENVNLVVNLDIPDDSSTYLHRIGRSGRFGSQGIAVTFVSSEKDRIKLHKLLVTIGNGMQVLMFPRNQNVDLWSISDPENERQLLGVFEENINVDTGKENYNNNVLLNEQNAMDLRRRQSLYEEEVVKLDVLSRLIDNKSQEKESIDKNRNLFHEFIEIVGSENPENKVAVENTKKSMLGLLCDLSKAVQDLDTTINPFDDYDEIQTTTLTQDTTDAGDFINEDDTGDSAASGVTEISSSIPETDTNPIETLSSSQHNKSGDDINANLSASVNNISTNIPENIRMSKDSKEIVNLQSLLIEQPKADKIVDDLFENYESFNCSYSKTPKDSLVDDDNKTSYVAPEITSSNAIISSSKPSPKPSKEAIKQAIREVIDTIVSSTDSLKSSIAQPVIFEPKPSTSRMAPKTHTSDLPENSDSSFTSYYPENSPIASASQTGYELFNISSDRTTDCMNISCAVSDLNTSTKDENPDREIESDSNPSSDSESNSTTNTASENEAESSGFDERTSPEPSSGVVTSESSISTDTSESRCSTSESDSEDSDSRIDCNERRSIRHVHPNSDNDLNVAYQTAYSQWTNFYWNQITQIQDYVRFNKYAGKNGPRYS